jgi:hypothetical protein
MSAERGWTEKLEGLFPGDHAAILTGTTATGIIGRLAGFELRDVLAVFLPGPSTGFVFLFRKPVKAPTVVAQVLATGTGGLNVAACRVGLSGGTKRSGQAQHLLNDDGTEDRSHHWARTGHTVVELAIGRWPPNVLFVHAPECRRVGQRRVEGNGHWPRARGVGGLSTTGHVGQDGLDERSAEELVTEWVCAPQCPVPTLDLLSGDRPSTLTGRADPAGTFGNPGDNGGTSLFGGGNSHVYADDGGASRFYPQFEDLDALLDWLATLVGENCHPSG